MLNIRIYFLGAIFILLSQSILANNISVANVSLTAKNTIAGVNNSLNYRNVQFDISWENSWRTLSDPKNWDAAWVFMKYRINGTGNWKHATLNAGAGQAVPTGGVIAVPADGVGAFIYRSATGDGTFSLTNAQLRWNYGVNGVFDNDIVEIKLFAIEMVYVPQGSMSVASPGVETNGLTNGPWVSGAYIPLNILSENELIIANTANSIWATGISSNTIGTTGSLPAEFPKGFAAFYCMKYETNQGQYRDFLNMLTYDQQVGLMTIAPNSIAGSGVLVNSSPYYRNGLVIQASGVNGSQPAIVACDLDRDGNFNEVNDGEFIACNYLSFKQGIAYLDWSGLRPMTELEFVKICKSGNSWAYPNFFVVNNANPPPSSPYILNNIGTSSESISNLTGVNNFNYISTKNSSTTEQGPFRNGIFATSSTALYTHAGATRIGVMEMGGNLYEQVINLVTAEGRAFTGLHGDGAVSINGIADVTNWPIGTIPPKSYGTKGGSWKGAWTELQIADRSQITNGITTLLLEDAGIRGVRSAY